MIHFKNIFFWLFTASLIVNIFLAAAALRKASEDRGLKEGQIQEEIRDDDLEQISLKQVLSTPVAVNINTGSKTAADFRTTVQSPGKFQLSFRTSTVITESQLPEVLRVESIDGSQVVLSNLVKSGNSKPYTILVSHSKTNGSFRVSTFQLRNYQTTWVDNVVQVPTRLQVLRPSIRANYRRGYEVQIPTSFRITPASVRNNLRFEPQAEFTVLSSSDNSLRLNAKLEPGRSYKLIVDGTLTSENGFSLQHDLAYLLQTPEKPPGFEFLTEGPYFPYQAQNVVPISVSGISKLKAEIFEVSDKNYLHFLKNPYRQYDFGKKLKDWEISIPETTELQQTVQIDLSDKSDSLQPGLYKLQLTDIAPGGMEDRWGYRYPDRESRLFLATDLAFHISSVDSRQYTAWITSMKTGKPVAGASVKLYSYQFDPLVEGKTDESGLVELTFEDLDGNQSPYAIGAEIGNDFSMMELNHSHFLNLPQDPLQAKGFTSRYVNQTQYETYAYTERDIYRPGDTINWGVLIKSNDLNSSISEVPFGWSFKKRNGSREIASGIANLDEYGLGRGLIELPDSLGSGTYKLYIHAPGQPEAQWGQASVIVRYLKPDTFKIVPSELPESPRLLGENQAISSSVKAEFLFGQPAKGFKAKLTAKPNSYVQPPSAYRDYRFTAADPGIDLNDVTIENRTNNEGVARLEFIPPSQWLNSETFTCNLVFDVFNGAGEIHHQNHSFIAMTHPFLIGTKVVNSDNSAPVLKWVSLDDDFKETGLPSNLSYEIFRRVYQRKLVENANGSFAWGRVTLLEKVESGNINEGDQEGEINLQNLEYFSNYVIKFKQADKIISTRAFSPNYSKFTSTTKEDIRFLDVQAIGKRAPGGESALKMDLPAAGFVRVDTQFGKHSISSVSYRQSGQQEISVNLPDSSFGSVHFIVTLIPDPALEKSKSLPSRLVGRDHIQLDQSSKKLDVALEYAEEAQPGENARVKITLSSNNKPAKGAVHLFGVDSGIIPSSRLNPFDPYSWFYGTRNLNADLYDMFDRIFPDPYLIEELNRSSAIGGGLGGLYLNPFSRDLEKLAVFSLDTIYIGESGETWVDFVWPELDGQITIFAIAVNENQIGYSEDSIQLQNPISVLLGGPVAVTSNDIFHVSALLTNSQMGDSEVKVSLESTGLEIETGEALTSLVIAEGTTETIDYFLKPKKGFWGNANMDFLIECEGFSKSFTLTTSVRPGKPRDFFSESITIPAGQQVSGAIQSPFIPETSKISIEINDTHLGSIKNALRWLQSYPYGCLEQTVSGAFPNLYLREFSGAGESIDPESGARKVYSALESLEFTFWNGQGFSMWGGNRSRHHQQQTWHIASLYTSQFIAESKKSGFKVGNLFEGEFKSWVTKMSRPDRLGSYAASEDVCYFLYILSLLGESDVEYLNAILTDFHTTSRAKLYIAGALSSAGQRDKAFQIINSLTFKEIFPTEKITRYILTDISAAAMALSIISEIDPENTITSEIISYLAKAMSPSGTWGTTFNNANVCIGMAQYLKNQTSYSSPSGTISILNEDMVEFDENNPYSKTLNADKLPYIIKNQGEDDLVINIYHSGVPKPNDQNSGKTVESDPEEEKDQSDPNSHITLVKNYFKPNSTRVPPDWVDGEEIEIEITIPENVNFKDIVIVDPFPGFLTPIAGQKPQALGFSIKNHDIREDRMVIFGDKDGTYSKMRYRARIRYRGEFSLPQCYAEVMYSPEIRAESPMEGRVTIR